MIGCYIKTAVLQGASRRTRLKPVALPNNAVPNRGLKGGCNMLTKCKSFADAFIIQTCGKQQQLDYATPRSTNFACSAVFKQNRFNSA